MTYFKKGAKAGLDELGVHVAPEMLWQHSPKFNLNLR